MTVRDHWFYVLYVPLALQIRLTNLMLLYLIKPIPLTIILTIALILTITLTIFVNIALNITYDNS